MAQKRLPNWSEEEKQILIDGFQSEKRILMAKFSAYVTSTDKAAAWQRIVDKINSQNNGLKRTAKQIQKKGYGHILGGVSNIQWY